MEGKKQYIFIDNGYDTMKCAQLSTNLYHDFDYFSLPTWMIPHLKDNDSFQFNKPKLEKKIEKFIDKEYKSHFSDRGEKPIPIHQGKLSDLDTFTYVWKKVVDAF